MARIFGMAKSRNLYLFLGNFFFGGGAYDLRLSRLPFTIAVGQSIRFEKYGRTRKKGDVSLDPETSLCNDRLK